MSDARKFCINCGKEIPSAAAYCPYCSQLQLDVLPKPAPPRKDSDNKVSSEKTDTKENKSPDESSSEKMEHVYKRSNTASQNIVPKEMRQAYRIERQEMTGDEKDELMKKAYIDQETGLYNQTKLDEKVKSLSPNDIVTIGVIKVTNYVSTMNAYGREEGNKLLKETADVIAYVCPKEAFKIEGGEFVILMFNRTMVELKQTLTTIINMLDERTVRNRRQKSQNDFLPEVSYGAAELKHGESFYAGLSRAEEEIMEDIKAAMCENVRNKDNSVKDEPGYKREKTKIRGNSKNLARDEYRSQKRSYNNALSKRLTETVVLAVVLFGLAYAKNYFGC